VLLPRRFRKAAALYRYAVRDTFMMPLTPRQVAELDWYFRGRRGDLVRPSERHGVTDGSASRGVNDPGGGRKAWPDRPIVWVVHTTACVSLKMDVAAT